MSRVSINPAVHSSSSAEWSRTYWPLHGRFYYVLEFSSVKCKCLLVSQLIHIFAPSLPLHNHNSDSTLSNSSTTCLYPPQGNFHSPMCSIHYLHSSFPDLLPTSSNKPVPGHHRALATLLALVWEDERGCLNGSSPSLSHLSWIIPRCGPTPF